MFDISRDVTISQKRLKVSDIRAIFWHGALKKVIENGKDWHQHVPFV